jgi:hypothetical protein
MLLGLEIESYTPVFVRVMLAFGHASVLYTIPVAGLIKICHFTTWLAPTAKSRATTTATTIVLKVGIKAYRSQ